MVAETHTQFDGLTQQVIVDFVLDIVVAAEVAAEITARGEATLESCGFVDAADIEELQLLVGEEFGERTLLGSEDDDGDDVIDSSSTMAAFVAAMYPDVAP